MCEEMGCAKELDRWKISRKWKLDATSGLRKEKHSPKVKLVESSPREKKLKRMNGLSRKIQ